jgi:hypothetical protein
LAKFCNKVLIHSMMMYSEMTIPPMGSRRCEPTIVPSHWLLALLEEMKAQLSQTHGEGE